MNIKTLLAACALTGPLVCAAAPISLTGQSYLTYGNTNSYSLPFSAIAYDSVFGGGTGPGNPYYVQSGPGQIKDLVVIYTGASGEGVDTNANGFDNAYLAPSGSHPAYASIAGAVNMTDPGDKAGIANNDTNTWDANLSALKAFLAGGNPLFLFNNNDTNQDQNLAIWAKLWITQSNGSLAAGTRHLYLSNAGAAYGLGGVLNGDASVYNPGDVLPTPGFAATDYVLSGGEVNGVNHNLGANQAAYAGDLPLLNDWLQTLFKLTDSDLSQYTMHLDLRLGCISDTTWGTCDNVKIDDGYEQLFMTSSLRHDVPEPGTLALAVLALSGIGAARRIKRRP